MNSKSNGKSYLLGTAVATGASSGLGKVYADRLAQRSYDLILVARRTDRLQNMTEALQAKYGIEANVIVADFWNSPDVQRVADTSQRAPCFPLRDSQKGSRGGVILPHQEII
jgi:short-subunit dehydrogenase